MRVVTYFTCLEQEIYLVSDFYSFFCKPWPRLARWLLGLLDTNLLKIFKSEASESINKLSMQTTTEEVKLSSSICIGSCKLDMYRLFFRTFNPLSA